MAFHPPMAAKQAVFADCRDHPLELDIAAGSAHHDLEFTSFDRSLMVLISEIQHIDRDSKTHGGFLSGLQSHPLKGLELFNGANEGSIHISDVDLDDFATLAPANILKG